ncbi:MAG: hypothetical protein HC921_21045 [Synechococcaceae cyanobacterium SM2_3_1]|nr:hypothetical protein [Synechococcaceae cyanobacterium SM2_3_1]
MRHNFIFEKSATQSQKTNPELKVFVTLLFIGTLGFIAYFLANPSSPIVNDTKPKPGSISKTSPPQGKTPSPAEIYERSKDTALTIINELNSTQGRGQ